MIPHVGPATAEAVAESFPNRCLLQAATLEDLDQVKGVSHRAACSIQKYFLESQNRWLLDRLFRIGGACARPDSDSTPAEPSGEIDTRRSLEKIIRFAQGMQIKGLGPLTAEELHDAGLLRDPADIFSLSPEKLVGRGAIVLGENPLGRFWKVLRSPSMPRWHRCSSVWAYVTSRAHSGTPSGPLPELG